MGLFNFRMTHRPTLVRRLALVGSTQLVYSGGDGGCQAEHHVILRLQSGLVFALQVGKKTHFHKDRFLQKAKGSALLLQ